MDSVVRRIAMAMATATNRRSFLAGVLRGVVALGLGASFVFGGRTSAFAANNCKYGQYDSQSGCSGKYWCKNGDSNGCGGLKKCSELGYTCGSDWDNPCPSQQPAVIAYWTCCCGGNKQTKCVDCGPTGGPRKCICTVSKDKTCS